MLASADSCAGAAQHGLTAVGSANTMKLGQRRQRLEGNILVADRRHAGSAKWWQLLLTNTGLQLLLQPM
jgi:hypothetical protein